MGRDRGGSRSHSSSRGGGGGEGGGGGGAVGLVLAVVVVLVLLVVIIVAATGGFSSGGTGLPDCDGFVCGVGWQGRGKDCQDPDNCRQTECCFELGGCNEFSCHSNTVPDISASWCRGEQCSNEECCVQTDHCDDFSCGENYLRRGVAGWCDSARCTRDECCAGLCSAHICGSNSVPKFGGQCSGLNCLDSDCCEELDRCSNFPCPVNFAHNGLVSWCNSTECSRSECCSPVGRCEDHDCGPTSVLKFGGQCTGLTCSDNECCEELDRCSAFQCPENFARNGFVTLCSSTECTRNECCSSAGQCAGHECGSNSVLKFGGRCIGLTCSDIECCEHLDHCGNFSCVENFLPNAAAAWCNSTVCTRSECCSPAGRCDDHECGSNLVRRFGAGTCNDLTCLDSECCEMVAHCSNFSCAANYERNGSATWCHSAACTRSECCTQIRDCDSVTCPAFADHSHSYEGCCRCRLGHAGVAYDGGAVLDICSSVACTLPNAAQLWPTQTSQCLCNDGFEGNIVWNFQNALWMGDCEPAPCNVEYSNHLPGPSCECERFVLGSGSVTWIGAKAYGPCVWGPPQPLKLGVQGGLFLVVPCFRILIVLLLKRKVQAIGTAMKKKQTMMQGQKTSGTTKNQQGVKAQSSAPSRPEKGMVKADVVICLIGATGGGKSATANLISGTSHFKSAENMKSVTEKCSFKDFVHNGKKWRVIDTPGLQDTNLAPKMILDRIKQFANFAPHGVDAFFFVWSADGGRFKDEHKKSVEIFKIACGDGVMVHSAVVYTRIAGINSLAKSPTHEAFSDWLKNQCETVDTANDIMRAVRWRVVGIDNEIGCKEDHRKNLLCRVETMIESNQSRFQPTELKIAEKWQTSIEARVDRLSKPHCRETMRKQLENLYSAEGTDRNAIEASLKEFEKDEKVTQQNALALRALWEVCKDRKRLLQKSGFESQLWSLSILLPVGCACLTKWYIAGGILSSGSVFTVICQAWLPPSTEGRKRWPLAVCISAETHLMIAGMAGIAEWPYGWDWQAYAVVSSLLLWFVSKAVIFGRIHSNTYSVVHGVTFSKIWPRVFGLEPLIAGALESVFAVGDPSISLTSVSSDGAGPETAANHNWHPSVPASKPSPRPPKAQTPVAVRIDIEGIYEDPLEQSAVEEQDEPEAEVDLDGQQGEEFDVDMTEI